MTILEKLKDVLEAEDLQKLNEYIKTMVNEEVNKRVAILAEERTAKLDLMAEKYVNERVADEKAKIEEENQKSLEEMEDRLISQLDSFLEEEINENISDEMLEKIAINETLLPIVTGIKKIFEESHVELDSEGSSIIKQANEEIETLKSEKSQLIAEKMEQHELLERTAKSHLITDKVEGLNEEQKNRVVAYFENKDFSTVQSDIDSMINLVVEEENKPVEDDEGAQSNDVTPEGDGIVMKKPIIEGDELSPMARAAQRFM